MPREETIVDATLIAESPSTKNRDRARAPEMHQSRKGKQWYFGMKAHIGVDTDSGLVHTVVVTSGNVSDVEQAHAPVANMSLATLGIRKGCHCCPKQR